jgi:predicted small integral membrane protein
MLDVLLRLSATVGPMAVWIMIFLAAIVAVFVLYIGIAMWAALRARDPEQRQVSYQVFRDLRDLFLRGKHQ